MTKLGLISALIALTITAAPAQAAMVFSQNFEGALGANESTSGAFTINNMNAPLNNGTRMMGHQGTYSNDEYSYYQLVANLTGVSGAAMQFSYAAHFENHFDRFNVLAALGAVSPQSGLLTPISGMLYEDQGDVHRPELGQFAFDTNGALTTGTAMFDLSAFDGQVVTLRFQFGSDGSVVRDGFNMDNLSISGTVSAIPEPGSLALVVASMMGFGLARTRKQ